MRSKLIITGNTGRLGGAIYSTRGP
ncbi:hypothetical protein FIV35_04850 [Pseudomonas rhodesiae]|nr:hypothetical protein E5845_04445 [Pseudomonas fluorescens]TWR57329.1 hypothetical protein FIV35_04850 [Pseudomonas rhodesiae]